MVVNQLFSVVPPFSLFTKILNCFGLENAKDKHGFTIDTMNSLNTIDKLKTIENEIKKYYVPCKVKIFFNQLDHKSAITILRQFARLYGYDIPSKEKFINHRKILIYRIITKIPKERKKKMTLRIDNDSSPHIPVSNSSSNGSENINSMSQNSNGNISNVNNDANTISQTNVTDTSLSDSSNANNPIIHHNRIEKTSRKIRKKQLMQSYQTNISPSTNDISSGYSNSGNNVGGNNNAISDNANANNKVAQQSSQPTQLTQKINKEYIVNFD
jgi:hypothetical protein